MVRKLHIGSGCVLVFGGRNSNRHGHYQPHHVGTKEIKYKAPPLTSHTLETANPPPISHVINGIDEGVTDMQPALNTHRETSVSIQADSENGPEFMIHTEVNGIEHNPENHGA